MKKLVKPLDIKVSLVIWDKEKVNLNAITPNGFEINSTNITVKHTEDYLYFRNQGVKLTLAFDDIESLEEDKIEYMLRITLKVKDGTIVKFYKNLL